MTSPDIQKEISNAAAVETINAIIKDIGDSLFAIIDDESRDMSTKEQLAIALRYVDKLGHVNERFLGITHVNNTSVVTLKSAIEEVFNKHSLSISRLRGQGYDGASNMRGMLGISNELSQTLQRKDQDIVNTMNLVDISKQRLQVMRDDGWNTLLEEVFAFCAKNNIDVPDMDDLYQPLPR
ncbi:hypothetical protein SO802_004839 [Lithocarpus litseifolius]|uniref:DUF4371 domain-containing protein n=1 Tax=Lithocarpus litseifolius TaxID=425828 RepID=A0AAW2DH14_9ROSI